VHFVTGKPNSFYDAEEGDEDPQFQSVINRANAVPTRKFTEPQTEAQEIGWMSQPLINNDRTDPRLFFPQSVSTITRNAHGATKPS